MSRRKRGDCLQSVHVSSRCPRAGRAATAPPCAPTRATSAGRALLSEHAPSFTLVALTLGVALTTAVPASAATRLPPSARPHVRVVTYAHGVRVTRLQLALHRSGHVIADHPRPGPGPVSLPRPITLRRPGARLDAVEARLVVPGAATEPAFYHADAELLLRGRAATCSPACCCPGRPAAEAPPLAARGASPGRRVHFTRLAAGLDVRRVKWTAWGHGINHRVRSLTRRPWAAHCQLATPSPPTGSFGGAPSVAIRSRARATCAESSPRSRS